MPLLRSTAMIALAFGFALTSASPCLARRSHGSQSTAADSKPANASAAVCRTRARDYAYEKHADAGGERMVFEQCMGH